MRKITILLIIVLFTSINSFSQGLDAVYKLKPDVTNCQPGILTPTEIDKVLQLVNKIRLLHKLPPVEYDNATQVGSMEGCLNIVASGVGGHIDDPTSTCYTPEGGQARMKSNLHYGMSYAEFFTPSEAMIVGWMIDDHNADKANEYKVGHRRAIINPFLKKFSFGRADGKAPNGYFMNSGNFHYQDFVTGATSTQNDFVAYPYENYPIDWFNKEFYLSFNVLANKTNVWGNQSVDLTQANVIMKDDKGNTISVSNISYDNEGWGSFPNNLSWKAAGLQNEIKYSVTIQNVLINGSKQEYTYWFRLTNSDQNTVPATPDLVSPSNNGTNINISVPLSWQNVPNASYFKLMFADNDQFNNPIYNEPQISGNSFQVSNLKNNTKYYWKVAAVNDAGTSPWSTTWNFTTMGAKPNAPTLVSPINNETINSTKPRLTWDGIPQTETFTLQVATDNLFSTQSLKYSKSSLTNNYADVTTGLMINTKYYWRVQSTNSSGSSPWSEIWSFNTGTALPQVVLSLPVDKSQDIALTPKLEWNKIDEATDYDLQLNTENNFTGGIFLNEFSLPNNYYTIPSDKLNYNTTYYWRVKANSINGSGLWSEVFSFTTLLNGSITQINNSDLKINNFDNNLSITSINNIKYVEIYQINGSLVYTSKYDNSFILLNIDHLNDGLYFIKIVTDNKFYVEKFLKY